MSEAARSSLGRPPEPLAILATLASLVLKERVLIGGLPAAQQAVALGLAGCAVPVQQALREAEVNVLLKRCLSEECSFLDVDHVELRRWLVDAGWLTRDGFGREYRRVATSELSEESAVVARALAGIEPTTWVAGIRAADAAQRSDRRKAWERLQAEAQASHSQGSPVRERP